MVFSPLNKAWDTIVDMIEGLFAHLPYLVAGGLVIIAFWLLAKLTRKIVFKLGDKSPVDNLLVKILSNISFYMVLTLGLLISAVVIFPDFNASKLVAGLGLSSVAIGFAFKDVLQNFFAGILILWQKPFRLGDQIIAGDFEGTIKDINIRATLMDTYDGRQVIIPNGQIVMEPITVNTAYTKRRTMMTVGIGYSENIENAQQAIYKALKELDGVLKDPGPWVYVSEFADSSINLDVYYWTLPDQATHLKVKNRVSTAIKAAFDEASIEIPFPQRVLHAESFSKEAQSVMNNMVTFEPKNHANKESSDDMSSSKKAQDASELEPQPNAS